METRGLKIELLQPHIMLVTSATKKPIPPLLTTTLYQIQARLTNPGMERDFWAQVHRPTKWNMIKWYNEYDRSSFLKPSSSAHTIDLFWHFLNWQSWDTHPYPSPAAYTPYCSRYRRSHSSTDDTPTLKGAIAALITDSNEGARTNIRVTDDIFPVTLLIKAS